MGEGHGTGKRCAVHPHGSIWSAVRGGRQRWKDLATRLPRQRQYSSRAALPTHSASHRRAGDDHRRPSPLHLHQPDDQYGTDSVPGGGNGGSGGTGDSGSGTVVSCAIPSDVTVFPGLSAQLVLAGGIAENVLVVPITAVEGAAGTGNVYFVLPDGSTELREVTLGLNDGVNVEVTAGLKEGDLILQFVPGAPSPTDGGMVSGNCYPSAGGMVCQG